MQLEEFLEALPDAAASPYAFLAYVLLLASSVAIAWNVTQTKHLLEHIEKFPEEQRAEILYRLKQVVLPTGITAGQWIEHKLHQYYLLAFISFLVCGTVVFAIAYADPKVAGLSWEDQKSLSRLKIGINRSYVHAIFDVPPFVLDLSGRLKVPGSDVVYERYPGESKELQIIYINGEVVVYVIRVFGKEVVTKKIHNLLNFGRSEWLVGKSKFKEAGDDPALTFDDFFWTAKSRCRIEKHYYGAGGGYNNFYYSTNLFQIDGRPSRDSEPTAVMVSRDICPIDDGASCEKQLLGLVCANSEDYERSI